MNEFKDLQQRIRLTSSQKGFYTPTGIWNDPAEVNLTRGDAMLGKLHLVASEIAEAGEAVRDGDVANFLEELADATIRIFDIAEACNLDLYNAVLEKIERNEQRPAKHGRLTTL